MEAPAEPKPVRRGKDMATIMEVVEGKDKAEAAEAAGEESDLEEEEEKDSDDDEEEEPEEAPKPVTVRPRFSKTIKVEMLPIFATY